MIKKLFRHFAPVLLDYKLKRAAQRGAKTVLVPWNRGLGDIPLGLYALVHRIRQFLPAAEITFLTRQDLAEGFALLGDIKVAVAPSWKRGEVFRLKQDISRKDFDLVLEKLDASNALRWQLGSLTPRLRWRPHWDALAESLAPGRYVGVQFQTETSYGYEKNWPVSHWQELFSALAAKGYTTLLFGSHAPVSYEQESVVDLRGKTTLFEMLSLIKNRCDYLIVPDSGVLSLTYYLDVSFPLTILSLWADPGQGVLKQNVPSPNPQLKHIPLIAPERNLSKLSVEEVRCLLP